MSEPYNGKCPVCGDRLQEVDGGKLSCVNGDYETIQETFEKLWREFAQRYASI